jgi:hypothetical protein
MDNLESVPVITFDIGLGKYVEDIDVDYEQLVGYMEQRGFTPEEIAATNIPVDTEESTRTVRTQGKKEIVFRRGSYNGENGDVELHPVFEIKLWGPLNRPNLDEESGSIQPKLRYYDEKISKDMSGILVHELEHKYLRESSEGEEVLRANHRHRIKSAAKAAGRSILVSAGLYGTFMAGEIATGFPISNPYVIGGIGAGLMALSNSISIRYSDPHQYYLSTPEETLCREATANGPDTLITIRTRPIAEADAL